MKTIKNIPNSVLTASDAEQAFMLISGVADRADYTDKIAYTVLRQYITQQLATRVSTIETSLGTISGGLSGIGTPTGVISMWYGADTAVPSGWAICNGQTVSRTDGAGTIQTPDLRDRVVMGAGTILTQGATGGAVSANATTNSAGGHSHTVGGGGHFHSIGVDGTAITVDQMPAHSHYEFVDTDQGYDTLRNHPEGAPNGGAHGSSSGASYNIGGSGLAATMGRSSSTGGNQPHTHTASITGDGAHSHDISTAGDHTHSVSVSTIQPAIGLHYIMKV